MFKWLDIRNIFDTPDEWHSFVNGLFEVICFWRPRVEYPAKELEYIWSEWHYYQFGRVLGVFGLVGIIALLKHIIAG